MNSELYKKLKKPGIITTPFMGETRSEDVHPGVDFANYNGAPITAFADGTITRIETRDDGTGNVITLRDKYGNEHQYSHLKKALVGKGEKVKKGQTIAEMGRTGNSYSESGGDPSHLDVRISKPDGQYINPLKYINNNTTMVK